jgi:hypothetical protein
VLHKFFHQTKNDIFGIIFLHFKMKKTICLLFIKLFVISTCFSIIETDNGKLIIDLNHFIGNQKLIFDTVLYKNELNQTYSVTNFKYYISNIRLKKQDGKEEFFPNYFLINEEDVTSKQIVLNNVSVGDYTSISFMIGVDSLHNCSGAQSGALDPANAMFWAWNSGYIFLKLEGKASASNSPGHIFEYHIGGYKQPSNCIRTVALPLDKINITSHKVSTLSLKVDASEIIKSPVSIDFSKLSSVTDFHNATTIADNYSDMFSVIKVFNEK